MEDISEEGIHRMVGREILLEEEELVHVIEDAMEEGTQKVRLAVDVLHFLERLIIDLLLPLVRDGRNCTLLAFLKNH